VIEQGFEGRTRLRRLELAQRDGGVGRDVVVGEQVDEQRDRQWMTRPGQTMHDHLPASSDTSFLRFRWPGRS